MNLLLAGVGGQGILFVTGLLAYLGMEKGWPVCACETHGMAQRGGSVVSHLRLGRKDAGPLIRKGKADLLLGLNEDEGLRHLAYLKKGGNLLLEQGRDKLRLEAVARYLDLMDIRAVSVPAFSLASGINFILGANLVLVGAASALGWLPFSGSELEKGLRALSKSNLLERNLESLRLGLRSMSEKGMFSESSLQAGALSAPQGARRQKASISR